MTSEKEARAERVLACLRQLVSESDELLKATVGELGEQGREARTRLQAALEGLKAAYRGLETRALGCASGANRVIRNRPYQSMGLAFSLGLVVGLLIKRSR